MLLAIPDAEVLFYICNKLLPMVHDAEVLFYVCNNKLPLVPDVKVLFYICSKLLPTVPDAEVVMSLSDTQQIDSRGRHTKIALLLTRDILFLVSREDDIQLQAFAVSEIDCRPSQIKNTVLYIILKDFTMECTDWVSGPFIGWVNPLQTG